MVKMRSFIFLLLLAGALPFALSACDSDGPAEQAGENVDHATEQTGDAVENTMDKAEDKADEMGDKIDRQTEN